MICRRHAAILLVFATAASALTGCAGPPVLEQQVLGYDQVTKTLDEKLLMINIARVANREPMHFTSTSSIAATFDWTTTLSAGSQIHFNILGTASENPTFTISPLSGEDFTRRIATPFKDDVFEFLVFQGARIDQVLRLMAAGIEVQAPDSRFVRFIENDPSQPTEYEEFRRIAMHLQWLNDHRQLFVRPLVFEETLVGDYKGLPRAEDINNGFNMGLRWRQKPNGHFELTRFKSGRIVVTNFDPMALSDRQRVELNDRIEKNPSGFVYLDIRPGGPGGALSLQGAIKLRSLFEILAFIARSIQATPEFDVVPDSRTGDVEAGPPTNLKINVSAAPPRQNLPTIYYDGRYFSLNDSAWDRTSFLLLSLMFQTALGHIENVAAPITISK